MEDLEGMENAESAAEMLGAEVEAIKHFIASRDVEAIVKSTSGFGTDEKKLIEVLCNRTKSQMQRIDAIMHEKHHKSLLECVKSDIGGNFGKLVTYALMSHEDLGAHMISKAVSGMGTDEGALIDLINCYSNEEIAATKEHWEAKNDSSLVDKMNDELKGDLKKIMLKLLLGSRSEDEDVDEDQAKEQAEALYDAGVGKRFGTDEDVFIDILSSASRTQVQAIKAAYEESHSQSLSKAIEKECNGDFKRVLQSLLYSSTNVYVSNAIHKAFEGLGTDDDRVCRLLASTDKKRMAALADTYVDVHGQTLSEALKDELSGNFKRACLSWVAGHDPSQGLEYAMEGLDGGDALEKAKLLLQERTHLMEHVCHNDAVLIREACEGIGTQDDELISIVCGRSKAHLEQVDRFYHTLYQRSILEQVQSEASGYFRDLMVYVLMPEDTFDAVMVRKACQGIGTNERMLIDVLVPLSNQRILAARERYEMKYDTPLIDVITSEVSGSLKEILVRVINGNRSEDEADEEAAAEQAAALYEAGQDKIGTEEGAFIDILCSSSRQQIQAIKASYESAYGCSLMKAIDSETSGDFQYILTALLQKPDDFYASQLKRAFKGMGTNDSAVCRVLGSNDKADIARIAECYLERYDQTLTEVCTMHCKCKLCLPLTFPLFPRP